MKMPAPLVAPREILSGLVETYIDFACFKHRVWVISGPDKDVRDYVCWRNSVDECPLIESYEGAFFASVPAKGLEEGKGSIIWIRELYGDEAIGVIAHESIHAAVDLMRSCGIPQSDATEEVLCYCATFITESLLAWRRTFSAASLAA